MAAATNAVVATLVVLSPGDAVGAVGLMLENVAPLEYVGVPEKLGVPENAGLPEKVPVSDAPV